MKNKRSVRVVRCFYCKKRFILWEEGLEVNKRFVCEECMQE